MSRDCMPGLGRPFHLGMLYDSHTDTILQGKLLCTEEMIMSATSSKVQECSSSSVIPENLLLSNMMFDNELKASYLANLIEVSGAASILQDHLNSTQQARPILKYKYTSHLDCLMLDKLQHPSLASETNATHVVTSILYGKEAYFLFDCDTPESESSLEELIGSIQIGVQNDASKIAQSWRKDNIRCAFYGDFCLPAGPIFNFNEVISICSNLPQSIESTANIPIQVTLSPLSNVLDNAPHIVNIISSAMISQVAKFLEEMQEIKAKCTKITKLSLYKHFPGIQAQLLIFSRQVESYKSSLIKQVSTLIPKIRAGKAEEALLNELFTETGLSPVNAATLGKWLEGKEQECKVLQQYISAFSNCSNIQFATSPEALSSMVNNFDYDYVLNFEFKVLDKCEKFLEMTSLYLKQQQVCSLQSESLCWYEQPNVVRDMRSKAKCFTAFARANMANKNIVFVVSEGTCADAKAAGIMLYNMGEPKEFFPPNAPGKPERFDAKADAITLVWPMPEVGYENIKCYSIYFKLENAQSNKWEKRKTKGTCDERFTIDHLTPDTSYVFKVLGECECGITEESTVSDPILTEKIKACSSPGTPEAVHISQDSITLTWDEPKQNHHLVQVYCVHYAIKGGAYEIKWRMMETEGPQNMLEINYLQPDTNYYFKVYARCTGGTNSNMSETSEQISTKQKTPAMKVLPLLNKLNEPGAVLSHYQLQMKISMKKSNIKIAKCTFGKRTHPPHPERVLMVVGATGAGKSTLINGIINYVFGVQWEDGFRLKLIVDEVGRSQTQSQTEWITAYTIYWHEGFPIDYTLTIIDTPGFGDTRGLERDRELIIQIKELFQLRGTEGIDQLHGIGFVTQASLARLTPTQRYIFDSILAIFGKDIQNNIFVMATFADGADPPVIEAIKEAQIPFEDCFRFNNSALFTKGQIQSDGNFAKMFWDMGVQSFERFFFAFSAAKAASLQLTQEVLNERHNLEAIICGIQPQINAGLFKIDELHQEENILMKRESEMLANKKFTYEIEVTKQKKVDLQTGTYVTNCLVCNYTCHYPCRIPNDGEKYGCAAMDNSSQSSASCTVCPGRCFWDKHVNNQYRFNIYQDMETRTSEDLKKRYYEAAKGKQSVQAMIDKMENEVEDIFSAVTDNIQEAHRCLQRLDDIALKPNPLTSVDYIDLLIEGEKSEHKAGYLNRIKYLQRAREEAEIISKVKTTGAQPLKKMRHKESRTFWQKLFGRK